MIMIEIDLKGQNPLFEMHYASKILLTDYYSLEYNIQIPFNLNRSDNKQKAYIFHKLQMDCLLLKIVIYNNRVFKNQQLRNRLDK